MNSTSRGGAEPNPPGTPVESLADDALTEGADLPAFQPISPQELGRSQLDALLAEYGTLRQESLNAITNRITIMNFTFGALSIVLAGLLATRVPTILAGITALVFVPQVAKAALLIWLGEYNRSQRAGRWLQRLETRINKLVEADVIGWESEPAKPRARRSHMDYPYKATVSLVIGAGYAGTIIGIYLLLGAAQELDTIWTILIFVAIVSYALILETIFLIYFMTRWREATGIAKGTAGAGRIEQALRSRFSRFRSE